MVESELPEKGTRVEEVKVEKLIENQEKEIEHQEKDQEMNPTKQR